MTGFVFAPSAQIPDGTLLAADLAAASVTTAKIADANVTAAKVASDAVTTAKILDANVTTAKIAAAAVTSAKIAANVYKRRCVTGRNGAGALTVSGAASTDTLESVLDLTAGADITNEFSTVGTGTLTQTSATDYSSSKLLIVLKAA